MLNSHARAAWGPGNFVTHQAGFISFFSVNAFDKRSYDALPLMPFSRHRSCSKIVPVYRRSLSPGVLRCSRHGIGTVEGVHSVKCSLPVLFAGFALLVAVS